MISTTELYTFILRLLANNFNHVIFIVILFLACFQILFGKLYLKISISNLDEFYLIELKCYTFFKMQLLFAIESTLQVTLIRGSSPIASAAQQTIDPLMGDKAISMHRGRH